MDIKDIDTQTIANEMGRITKQHVNIMDTKGVIVASTDPARLNTFHAGSAHLLESGLAELIIHSDDQFPGTRRGINLPINLNGQAIGVVGITGSYEQVIGYGNVIKKMTEILILEIHMNQRLKMQNQVVERFLGELLDTQISTDTDAVAQTSDILLQLLDQLPKTAKIHYQSQLFKHHTPEEKEEAMTLLQTYFEHNRSIEKTAQTLFVHKNTVQYKLNKIIEKTGYNPRQIKDAVLLYLGIQFEG